MIVLAGVMCGASTAFAQIPSTKPYGSLMVIREVVPVERPWLPRIGDVVAPPLLTPIPPARDAVRPAPRALLPSLYVGDIALQILDSHSTLRALDAGHVEGNPLMRWSAGHPVALVSMKAAATAGTIYVAEKIRKKHPRRAVLFMVGINAASALIVMHNYRTAN
jgi:hypothetical protein